MKLVDNFGRFLVTLGLLTVALAQPAHSDVVHLTRMNDQKLDSAVSCYAHKAELSESLSGSCDARSAYLMALLSLSSYSDADVAIQLAKDLGFSRVVAINDQKREMKLFAHSKRVVLSDTKAIWAENDDFIVLSFQGTSFSNKLSVVTDFLTKKVEMGEFGKVHSGYYGAILTAWKDIHRLMLSVKKPKPIYITGHSMGGALAILTAAQILQHQENQFQSGHVFSGPYLQGLFTFGAPKAGDGTFVDSLEKLFSDAQTHPILMSETPGEEGASAPDSSLANTLVSRSCSVRFQHADDIVSRLPWNRAPQLPNLMEFDSDGKLYQGDKALAVAHHSFFRRYILFRTGIGAHDMRYYMEDTYQNLAGHASGCL